MKVYITKWALTEGILEWEVELVSEDLVKHDGEGCWVYVHGKGRNWHMDLESAVARAESMRKKKILSLKNQVMELEARNFETDAVCRP